MGAATAAAQVAVSPSIGGDCGDLGRLLRWRLVSLVSPISMSCEFGVLAIKLAKMRRVSALTIGWLFLSGLAAQEKPYQEGDVDAFLRGARGEGRPAVVLFNFDEKSG